MLAWGLVWDRETRQCLLMVVWPELWERVLMLR